jgi:hypothetical protein
MCEIMPKKKEIFGQISISTPWKTKFTITSCKEIGFEAKKCSGKIPTDQ